MKYEIKNDGDRKGDGFEINRLTILKEWTRTLIFGSTVGVWLVLILVSAYQAAVADRYGDLEAIVNKLTPIVTGAIGWYLAKADRQ
jgi:hypothetical protein